MSEPTPGQEPDTTPGIFSWNELTTSDAEAAEKFYSGLFGWTVESSDMGDFVYKMFKVGERYVGGMMQMPAGMEAPPNWLSYVNVADINASVEKAKALGATVVKDITAIPDAGTFAVLLDPQGAAFAFWEPACKEK